MTYAQYDTSRSLQRNNQELASGTTTLKETVDEDATDKEKAEPKENPEKNNDQKETEESDGTHTNTSEPNTTARSDRSDTRIFDFVKGGGNATNTTVSVSEAARSRHTGTCMYTFTLGNSEVQRSNTIHNSNTCSIDIPISAFPKSGDWMLDLTFTSEDGRTHGSGGGYAITVNPQPRTIEFTKGGASYDKSKEVVSASSTLSEAHSGTCTYTFLLNGDIEVQETNHITDAKTCRITIPRSKFPPKSATLSYELSFESDDSLVIADQLPFNVTVK